VRIAIVTETFLPQVNGTVCMLLEFLTYLQTHGHEAIVFGPGDGERPYRGVAIAPVHGPPLPLYPELILVPYSTLVGSTLRAWRPDIVHLAGPGVLGLHGLSMARALGVPVAAHYQTHLARHAEHLSPTALAGQGWRRLLDIHNDCDATFVPSPSVARELRERGMLRVHVCTRGVDTRLFHPTRRDPQVRARLTGGRERPILLYVGRLSPEKNLAALNAVARALPDYPLLIVGDGPARGMLAAQLGGLDVHFAGVLHGEDLAAAYASADIFLFPSATETFGQVVREAMASSLPVIGVQAGGVQDLICDGETGLLCAAGDEAALVAAARHLAEDATVRRTMGAAARQEAERHTWDAAFDHLMTCYGCLVSRQPVPLIAVGEQAAP
jgi:phosphatidylinositol alpha 1,6-mannosyltransferase